MSTLTYEQVRETYLDTMDDHIDFTTNSTKCSPEMVIDMLGLAAVNTTSLHSACDVTRDAPTSAAVLYQLHHGWLDAQSLPELGGQLNQILVDHLPPRICGRSHRIAIDLTYIPYHGQHDEHPNEIRRSAAKAGTTHFHVYASAYIIYKHKRVTVATAYYRADETLFALLQRLLARLQALEIGVRQLFLDRKFCTVKIFDYLQQQSWQSIIPVVAHSRELRDLRHTARRSHQRPYTMSSEEDDVTFDLHVVCQYAMGRRGKHGIDVLYFAVLGHPWTSTPAQLAWIYGQRFGVETSYRLMNSLRIRTSSRDPKLRFLFVVLAFILLNLWIFLTWTVLAVPRQGGRYQDPDLFRLEKFRYFLREAIHEIWPPVLKVSRPVDVF